MGDRENRGHRVLRIAIFFFRNLRFSFYDIHIRALHIYVYIFLVWEVSLKSFVSKCLLNPGLARTNAVSFLTSRAAAVIRLCGTAVLGSTRVSLVHAVPRGRAIIGLCSIAVYRSTIVIDRPLPT